MPSTQFSDNPLQVWVNYTVAPAQITSISVANPTPRTVTAEVQRNNGQWTAFAIAPNTPLTQSNVNPAQYTLTVDVNGEINVCPNLRYG